MTTGAMNRMRLIGLTRTRTRTRTAIALIALGGISAVATVARAQTEASDAPQVRVNYTQAELSTEQGARSLYRRIAAAARQVCPGEGEVGLHAALLRQRCVTDAIARAVRDVNNPLLARLEAAARTRRWKQG
jgi:UrcA family protein